MLLGVRGPTRSRRPCCGIPIPGGGCLVPGGGRGNLLVGSWEAARRGRTQPDPHRRDRPRRTPHAAELRPAARRHRRSRTPGRRDVPVDDDRGVQLPRGGRHHLHRPDRRDGPLGHAQRRRPRRQHLHRGRRAAAARPGRAEHARRHRRLPLLQHRRGPAPLPGPGGSAGLPLHPVRAGRRQADVRLLRPTRPQGRLHPARGRAVRLAGHLQHRRPDDRGGPRRLAAGALHPDEADLHLPGRAHRRPLRQGDRLARGHPAGPLLPGVARAVPGPGRPLRRHQAGLRLLPQGLRLPVPVRQVRPALRAGVQRRGHGERRGGDLPRGLRLPLEGQPGHLRAARGDDPARARAHVVRRPRDHAVVGRPLAQRVVRDLHQHPVPGRGDRVHDRLDDVRQHREGLGLRAGPAAVDPPDRRGHPRRRRRRGQLRRHHLRQGRLGAQAAGRLRRPGRVPRRRAAVLPAARVRQHHARRPADAAVGELRARPVRMGRPVAADQPGQHAAAGVRADRRRPVRELRDRADRRRRAPGAAQPPAGGRPLQRGPRRPDPQLPGGARRRRCPHRGAGPRGPPGRGPRPGQRRRPHLRQAAPRRAVTGHAAGPASAPSPTRCRVRCAGRPPGT